MKTPFNWQRTVRKSAPKELGIDVVCNMEIELADIKHHARYGGATYYFCSADCRQHFENTPLRYIGSGRKAKHESE